MEVAVLTCVNLCCISLKLSYWAISWLEILAENLVVVSYQLNPKDRVSLCHWVLNLTNCYAVATFNLLNNWYVLLGSSISSILNHMLHTSNTTLTAY